MPFRAPVREVQNLVLMALAGVARLAAQTPGVEFFEDKIRPVLVASCYRCHSSKMTVPMGGLVLDTKAGILRGGNSGPVVVPGKPAESLLLRALQYNDAPKMPPSGKLPDSVVKDFAQWIEVGAPDPRVETQLPGAAAGDRRDIDIAQGRKWWAFQPVKELSTPLVKANFGSGKRSTRSLLEMRQR